MKCVSKNKISIHEIKFSTYKIGKQNKRVPGRLTGFKFSYSYYFDEKLTKD